MQTATDYTVIIANGEFPKHAIPLDYIKNASTIICLDGALEATLQHNFTPHAIVGDLDSTTEEQRKQFKDILKQYNDQETNDLTKAVNYCIHNGLIELKVVAATGKREDHTLGNISLLLEYMKRANVEMITDYGIFTPIASTTQFASRQGQQVSIFNIDRSPITSHNLKYPLQNLILKNWWMGTLNESLGDTFTIQTTGEAIVYRTFDTKER